MMGTRQLEKSPGPVRLMEPGLETHLSVRMVRNQTTSSVQAVLVISHCHHITEECTVELVGDIVVQKNSASFSFRGVGSQITRYICKVDGVIQPDCTLHQPCHVAYIMSLFNPTGSSPLTGLSPGQHRLRVVPVGCEVNRGVTFRFTV